MKKKINSWRGSVFETGKTYLIKSTFESLRYSFTEKEELTFLETTYSAYDGYTGFVFKTKTNEKKVIDLHDDENIEILKEKIGEKV